MKRSEAFPSQYVSKDDVMAGPIQYTIASVRMETVQGEGGPSQKPVMTFTEPEAKSMVVNSINWEMLAASYGDDSDSWAGKVVELYHEPNVFFGPKRVGGVRVRVDHGLHDFIPPSPSRLANVPLTTTPGAGMGFAAAVALAATANITKEQLIAALKARGKIGYSPSHDGPLVEEIVAGVRAAQMGTEDFGEPGIENPTGEDIPFN